MPDLDDLILTLDRLHDVLGERPALWRTTTGIEVTQAIQHYRSREHLTDPADRAPDNAATLVAYKAAIVRAYVRPPIGKSTGDAVGGTLLRGLLADPARQRVFNIGMALLLAASLYPILVS